MSKDKNLKKFILLWLGELISSVGGGISSFGLSVYVFLETGSAASTALVTLVAFLPMLILSVPAGLLADRFDRRLLMIIGDGFSALGLIYIFLSIKSGGITLVQICFGVGVSSVFSALLEPSYRATISDLLTKEEFSKAIGLVSIAGSARYLFSPLIAGILLVVTNIETLLIIDACSFLITIVSTAIVKKELQTKEREVKRSPFSDFKEGCDVIFKNKGILILLLLSSFMTCSMGTMQILAEPLILSFNSSAVLGIGETVCASGMLVSSLYLGMKGLKKNYVRILAVALGGAGVAMVFFGLLENIVVICISGFLFFAMLPFINNCLDYLVRTNISDDFQGRSWGLVGFISQIGYVVAFCFAGVGADYLGKHFVVGVGRGSAYVIMIAGVAIVILAIVLDQMKVVRRLEEKDEAEINME